MKSIINALLFGLAVRVLGWGRVGISGRDRLWRLRWIRLRHLVEIFRVDTQRRWSNGHIGVSAPREAVAHIQRLPLSILQALSAFHTWKTVIAPGHLYGLKATAAYAVVPSLEGA